jgi:Domain of unknown function (DUF6316)
MLVGRRDERSKTWFRSDRVFHTNGRWYFHTREGIDIGPYESQLEAEIEAGMLKELIKNSGVNGESLAVLRDFILESFSLGRPLNVMITDTAEHIVVSPPAGE